MDSICVCMPETLYEFLNAMASIQDYQIQIAVGAQRGQRDSNYQVTFRMKDKFKYFAPCLQVVKDNVPIFDYFGWDVQQRGEYDCFIKFDNEMFAKASVIAKTIGAHITSGLNTLIGSGAPLFPVLTPLQLKQDPSMVTDVLILNWNLEESNKLYQYITRNYPQLEVVVDERDIERYTPQELINYINHFHCVIGPMGVGTYLGGILKKTVLEIFETQDLGMLYGAIGAPGYFAVISRQPSADYLWTVWERNIWPELLSRMKSLDEQGSMVLPPSTAVNVDEKSGDNPIHRSEQ